MRNNPRLDACFPGAAYDNWLTHNPELEQEEEEDDYRDDDYEEEDQFDNSDEEE